MTVQLLCNEYVIFVTAAEKVKRDALQDYQSQELLGEIESQEECVACQG